MRHGRTERILGCFQHPFCPTHKCLETTSLSHKHATQAWPKRIVSSRQGTRCHL